MVNFTSASSQLTILEKGEKPHRDDSGVVRQQVTRGHVTRLVLVTSNIQGELHRALLTEILTGAVLQENLTLWC